MRLRCLLLLPLLLASLQSFANANIVIVNGDAPGVGLNDMTPAVPVGGNNGTTLGQQRLNVFQAVANAWGQLLNSPVDIRVYASFAKLDCTADSAVLGSTSAAKWVENFTNAPQKNAWYPVALADAIGGTDLNPTGPHMVARFNSQIDLPSCLGGTGWYYGLDGVHGSQEDFYVVALHEFAHGLGFEGLVDTSSGSLLLNNDPSVFDQHVIGESTGLHLSEMTDDQRLAAVTDNGKVSWDGASTRSAAPSKLAAPVVLSLGTGADFHEYAISRAGFGGAVPSSGIAGPLVPVQNAASSTDASTSDACSPLLNAAALSGKVAFIDRGTCKFTDKARAAQQAGAIAVVIADNKTTDCGPVDMGGDDPSVTIPVVGLSYADGQTIKSIASSTTAVTRIFRDATKLAGTSSTGSGNVLLFTPCQQLSGSTLYHWDATASPDLLMEAFIHSDTAHDVDLALNQLLDIGWTQAPFPGRRVIVKRGRR